MTPGVQDVMGVGLPSQGASAGVSSPTGEERGPAPSQPSLFDAPATQGASRKVDPPTSKAAAKSLAGHVLRDQQALVLSAVGPSATSWEACCDLMRRGHGIQQNVVAKRLGELAEEGMVRLTGDTRPGISHRHQRVYSLTAAGRAYLADRSAA